MYSSYQTFTAECSTGTSGDTVTRGSSAESVVSQRDADQKALSLARKLAFDALACSRPSSPETTIYYSAEVTREAYNDAGYVNETFSVTLPAGSVYSTVSQQDADEAAARAAEYRAELKRDAEQRRIYYNTELSKSAECGLGYVPYTASVTINAGEVSSESSQAEADALALQAANDLLGTLLSANCDPIYYSARTSYTATCTTPGDVGNDVTVSYPVGQFTSLVSQADADSIALAAATAAAEVLLVCVSGYWNEEQSYTATCEGEYGAAWGGSDSTVVVAAGSYFGDTQHHANETALAVATAQAIEGLRCSYLGGFPGA